VLNRTLLPPQNGVATFLAKSNGCKKFSCVFSATCVSRGCRICATRLKIGAMLPGCSDAPRKLAGCVGIR